MQVLRTSIASFVIASSGCTCHSDGSGERPSTTKNQNLTCLRTFRRYVFHVSSFADARVFAAPFGPDFPPVDFFVVFFAVDFAGIFLLGSRTIHGNQYNQVLFVVSTPKTLTSKRVTFASNN